mmetsp:Transcript_5229/g.12753  ORF Transcript_5229/g.12753 Transcript_5229/m.12753 type:complete len:87 (+) Transcript_5229:374-634(+)
MRPPSTTQMRSARCTVDRRCAITITVFPFTRRSIACCTRRSLAASRALVASSRMMIGESLQSARAIATRCRWPPESMPPLCPTYVS